MDINVLQSVVNSVVMNLTLGKTTALKHIERINKPFDFYGSKPKKYIEKATKNGETAIQREIYRSENRWYDLELPIGQYKGKKQTSSIRIDLIGKIENKLTLCELKYTKGEGQPLDALLQLISYYIMLLNNASKLDQYNIHHENAEIHNKTFKWTSFANEPLRLMLLANKSYWRNWHLSSPKNDAVRLLIKKLGEYGLDIELWLVNEDASIQKL